MSSVRYGAARLEHRAEHPVGAGQRPHRGDQPVAHAGDEEPPEAPVAVGNPERGVPRAGQLPGRVDEPLQDLVDRQLRGHGENGVADGLQRWAQRLGHRLDDSFRRVPRYWFWLQVLIIVFVVAGMVIAITKLA